MSETEKNLRPEEKKKRDRAIWIIYFFMIILIVLPFILFAAKHLF